MIGNEQTTAEQGRNKKGTSHHLWKLKLKQTGKKTSSSPGKVVITLQSATHLTKSQTGTVLIGGSQLTEGVQIKAGKLTC